MLLVDSGDTYDLWPYLYVPSTLLQVSSSGVTLAQYKGSHDNDNDIDQGVYEDQSYYDNDEDNPNTKNGPGRKYIEQHYPHYVIVDGKYTESWEFPRYLWPDCFYHEFKDFWLISFFWKLDFFLASFQCTGSWLY